ncbi:early nodulin protein [Spatholobus suberectus]|nr:early nodulin protein [Spatholobus suberectus]
MAILFKASYPLFLGLILFCGASLVNCTEFEVGGHEGWIVPKSKDNDQMYNQWASQNRFKVNDTLRLFYFISGVSGHCDRGQKMIIKVLDIEAAPSPQSANENAPKLPSKGGVAEMSPMSVITTSTLGVMSIFVLQLYA